MKFLFLMGAAYFAIMAVVFAGDAVVGTAPALIEDRESEQTSLSSKLYPALQGGNFDLLESIHQKMLVGDERFSDGTTKLSCYYITLSEPQEQNEEKWKDFIVKIDAWRAAKPDSVLADVVKARALTEYAWFARGGGWADSVTTDGWKLMGERLVEAKSLLDGTYAAHHGKTIPPGWFSAMQVVALGQGWSHEDYDKLFNEAATTYPDYERFYFDKAYFLQTKWYGQPGEWQSFVEATGKKLGREYYARICWSVSGNYDLDSFFSATQISWPEMREGFEVLEKQWPASGWNVSSFCRFACAARDKPTAKRLFDKMGDVAYTDLWGSIEDFKAAKDWAASPGP